MSKSMLCIGIGLTMITLSVMADGWIRYRQRSQIDKLKAEIVQRDLIIQDLLKMKLPPSKIIKPKRVKPKCPPCVKCPK